MQENKIILYQTENSSVVVNVLFHNETFWLTQKRMSELFNVDVRTINEHLNNIFKTNELPENPTIRNFRIVQKEGTRDVSRDVLLYNLDAIIAVGYRVNSVSATQFRIWATKALREFVVKGFVLNDEMLKNGAPFGKDYFDELLERIKEIRASERRFYQKITDIYQQCSCDYDSNSPITRTFFKTVQNKLLFAITKCTASEIIKNRVDIQSPNMGLKTWKNAPSGKIIQSDVTVSKNYLNQEEIYNLNNIVNMYLDYAENLVRRQTPLSMQNWVERLDAFLKFNEYDILNNFGSVQRKVADALAIEVYNNFRIKQDADYISDFDKTLNILISKNKN